MRGKVGVLTALLTLAPPVLGHNLPRNSDFGGLELFTADFEGLRHELRYAPEREKRNETIMNSLCSHQYLLVATHGEFVPQNDDLDQFTAMPIYANDKGTYFISAAEAHNFDGKRNFYVVDNHGNAEAEWLGVLPKYHASIVFAPGALYDVPHTGIWKPEYWTNIQVPGTLWLCGRAKPKKDVVALRSYQTRMPRANERAIDGRQYTRPLPSIDGAKIDYLPLRGTPILAVTDLPNGNVNAQWIGMVTGIEHAGGVPMMTSEFFTEAFRSELIDFIQRTEQDYTLFTPDKSTSLP